MKEEKLDKIENFLKEEALVRKNIDITTNRMSIFLKEITKFVEFHDSAPEELRQDLLDQKTDEWITNLEKYKDVDTKEFDSSWQEGSIMKARIAKLSIEFIIGRKEAGTLFYDRLSKREADKAAKKNKWRNLNLRTVSS